ncbi:MAG: class I SAM-dependent methyltransferase [Dehalococcoidia bacterium]
MSRHVEFGMGRGKVYPHEKARSLLNPLRRLLQPPARLAGRLHLREDARVLELGCGPGYFSVEVSKRLPVGHLYLFDLQREMLDMARSRLHDAGRRNVSFVQGDALRLPFRDAYFDVVFLVTVLGEVGDPVRCLREVHRVLIPGGLVSISEVRGDADFISFRDLRSYATNARLQFERKYGLGLNYTANYRRPDEGP